MTLRTRTRSSLTEVNAKSSAINCAGATADTPVYGNYVGEIETTTDVVTPNFHSRKAKGDIINNPFHSLKQEYGFYATNYRYHRSASCSGTLLKAQEGYNYLYGENVKNYGSPVAWNNYPFTELDSFNAEVEQQKTLVGTRCYAGVVPAEVQGLTELAEFTKTLRLVRHPIQALQTYVNRMRKTRTYAKWQRRSHSKDLSKFLSDEWLVMRYGFTPLVLAIDESLSAVTAERRSKRQTARSSSNVNEIDWTGSVVNRTGWSYNWTETPSLQASASVRAGQLYEHVFGMEDKYGFAAHDIASTLWEIFPYSFVADWLVNMQDYIRATTPKAGVRHIADWTTVEKTVTRRVEFDYTWNSPSGFVNDTSPGGYMYRTDVEKVRNPGISVGLSSKHRTIKFEAPKDWLHLADGISLIISNLNYR